MVAPAAPVLDPLPSAALATKKSVSQGNQPGSAKKAGQQTAATPSKLQQVKLSAYLRFVIIVISFGL